MYQNTFTHTQTETSQKGSDGFGWQTFLLDLRDCCLALDAVVVIVIVIITASAVVVVAVRFIDFPHSQDIC